MASHAVLYACILLKYFELPGYCVYYEAPVKLKLSFYGFQQQLSFKSNGTLIKT